MLEVIIQVKDDVICIPKPEDVKEGDLVEVRVRKVYADPELKSSFLKVSPDQPKTNKQSD